MSLNLYGLESLRFWTEAEIDFRESFTASVVSKVKSTLSGMNRAWHYHRVDAPLLTPRAFVSESYDDDDIFVTQIQRLGGDMVLRPETTAGSYAYAKHIMSTIKKNKLPMCVWQSGKSFRVEASDGATAAKLRFNEFYQLEFQCVYSKGTMADYRQALIDVMVHEIKRQTMVEVRVIDSDRLPEYSESTIDIECMYNGEWKEVASCSVRTDFDDDSLVCEIAIGLDRIVEIAEF